MQLLPSDPLLFDRQCNYKGNWCSNIDFNETSSWETWVIILLESSSILLTVVIQVRSQVGFGVSWWVVATQVLTFCVLSP
jgi:hypothetical protein